MTRRTRRPLELERELITRSGVSAGHELQDCCFAARRQNTWPRNWCRVKCRAGVVWHEESTRGY